MKYISTKKAPSAIGPYSQAVEHNGLIFCSGQIGMDPVSGELKTGVEEQARQVLTNLKDVLFEAGSDFSKVLKTTVYLADIKDFPKVNGIYEEAFGMHKPARATVQAAALPKGALVEIDAIATK